MSRSSDMSTSNQYLKYYIEAIQGSQSIADNTTSVTVRVWFYRTNSYTSYGTGTVYCRINGTLYSAGVSPSQKITSSPICLFDRTVTVSHAGDGTKTLSLSAWISHDVVSSSEQSWSVGLTTIPRASSIGSVSSPVEVNGSNAITVGIIRLAAFTHTVVISFGNYSHTIYDVGASASFVVPTSWLNAIPNAVSGTGTVVVQTRSGGVNIGSPVSASFTLKVPASYVPSFSSVTASPVNDGTHSAWGIYVQGKSRCKLSINGASAGHGASVRSYSITGGGFSSASQSYTTAILPNSGNITFTAKVTDSRGRVSAAKTVTISVQPYNTPGFSNMQTYRCGVDGIARDDGTYLRCVATYNYSSCGGKNKASAKVYYRRSGTTGVLGEKYDLLNGIPTVIGRNGVSEDYTYEAVYEISDEFITTQTAVMIPTSFNTMDFKRGGHGVAFGKSSEAENAVEIAREWTLRAHGPVIFDDYNAVKPSYGAVGAGCYTLIAEYNVLAAHSDFTELFAVTESLIPRSSYLNNSLVFEFCGCVQERLMFCNVRYLTEPMPDIEVCAVYSGSGININFKVYIRCTGNFTALTINSLSYSLREDGIQRRLYRDEAYVTEISGTPARVIHGGFLAAHPVGSIYMTTNATNPASLFGGTWVAWGEGYWKRTG